MPWLRAPMLKSRLRFLGIVTKVTHFARSVSPEILRPALEDFDRHLRETVEALIMPGSLGEKAWTQCGLPIKMGGTGLTVHASMHRLLSLSSCGIA